MKFTRRINLKLSYHIHTHTHTHTHTHKEGREEMVNFVTRKRVKKERKRKRGKQKKRKRGKQKKRKEERKEVMKKETKENKRNPLSHKGHHFPFFFLCGDHFTEYVYIKPKYQVTYIKYIQF